MKPALRIVRADEDPAPLADLPRWAPPPPIAPRFVPVTPPTRTRWYDTAWFAVLLLSMLGGLAMALWAFFSTGGIS